MHLEVEQKFLVKDDTSLLEEILEQNPIFSHIDDYYLSPTSRIRYKQTIDARTSIIQKSEYFLTIKSDGTLERYEYEYKLGADFELPLGFSKPVSKNRFYYKEDGFNYEVNYFHSDFTKEKGWQLIIAEVELDDLPFKSGVNDWRIKEVTEDKTYYGYNLFKIRNEGKVLENPWEKN